MTWGSPSGRSRWGPAKLAYGGTPGPEEERRAFEASLSAGVDLFDTAAMYSGGASERRVGELAGGKGVVIATKFPPGWRSKAEVLPEALDQSLVRLRRSTIDLYQHHFPSRRISIPALMGFMADAVDAGKVRAVGVSNYSAQQLRTAHAALAERGVNGQVEVPGGGREEVLTPGVAQVLFMRVPPWLRACRMRNDSPSVTTTMLWCSSRSSRLTAVVCSGRKRPHCSNGQCEPMPRARRS